MTLSASRPAEATAAGVLTVHGHDDIAAFDREIDELAIRCGAPVTARWAWMWPTLQHAGAQSLATLVVDDDGSLAAAALLVHEVVGDHNRVTLAAGGEGHRAPFLALDDAAAGTLASAIALTLTRLDGPVRFHVGPTALTDATARRLHAMLPGKVRATSETIPLVRHNGSDVAEDYLSDGTRRTLRKSRNRLRTDGLATRVHRTRDRHDILATLSDVAAVSRRRDHAGGRSSPLDDTHGLRQWEGRIASLAALAVVELSTLFIGDEPAAYVLGVIDGSHYRVLEGRFVMEWARYSPGRLLEADVLQLVLDSEHLDALDWMTSIAPDRLLCANDGELAVRLDAVL